MNKLQYVIELENQATKCMSSMRPITYMGVDGSGQQYLFSLLSHNDTSIQQTYTTIPIDFSATNGTDDATSSALCIALKNIAVGDSYTNLQDGLLVIDNFSQKQQLQLLINLPYTEQLNPIFWEGVTRMFNTNRWNMNILIFTTPKILSDPILSNNILYKRFTNNLVFIHPNTVDDTFQLLSNLEEELSLVIPDSIRQTIVELSGGHPGLCKELVQQYNQLKSEETINYLNSAIYQRISRILVSLREEELVELVQLVREKREVDSSSMLYVLGIIKDDGTVFSSLVYDFISNEKTHLSDLMPKALGLTKSERKLYMFFVNNSHKILSRDEVAQAVWEKDTEEKYSDWAIDQLIYSLRKKIVSSNLSGKIITKRSEGYVYEPSTTN